MPPPVNNPLVGLALTTGATFQTELAARDALDGRRKGVRALLPFVGPALIASVGYMDSGISSSGVGTMAGQVIMQGFVGFSIPVWARRLITMVPAFVVALSFNAITAMILSQVVLSLVLPLPMVALVVLSSRKSVMGDFVTGNRIAFVAIAATVLIMLLNAVLIRQLLE